MKYRTPHRAGRVQLARVVAAMAAAALALAGFSDIVLTAVPASASSTVVVTSTKTPKGTVLESAGATLYILEGNKPCNAQCLKIWPTLDLAKGQSKAKAGSGVKHAKLSFVKHGNVRQVTYNGKALYKFVGDHGAGQVNGDITDTWGTWAAVVVGKAKSASSHTTQSTSGSGGTAF